MARAQGLQQRFDDGHATLNAVEARLAGAPPPVGVRVLLERGRLFRSAKQPERALPLFERAWHAAREAGLDGYAVDAAHMRALVGTKDEALGWNRIALDLATSSDDPAAQRWQGSLCNNLGWALHARGDFAGALEHFERALAHNLRREPPAPERVRIARWTVARGLRSLGRCEEALALQTELREQLEADGRRDGYVDEEIGECLLALGREAEATGAFARAYEELRGDPWLARDEPERLERLRQLGRGISWRAEG